MSSQHLLSAANAANRAESPEIDDEDDDLLLTPVSLKLTRRERGVSSHVAVKLTCSPPPLPSLSSVDPMVADVSIGRAPTAAEAEEDLCRAGYDGGRPARTARGAVGGQVQGRRSV